MTTIPASNDQHDAPRDYDTGVRSVADTDLPPRSAPFGGDASEAAPGRGRVIFVGTGPGDPELLTLMAVQSLADADALMALMAQDKKVKRGRLTFILLEAVGRAVIANDVEPSLVREFLVEKLARKS